MRMFLLAFVSLVAGCTTTPPVAAQSAQAPRTPVENCVVEAGGDATARRSCVGRYTRQCVESSEANQTTGGMARCAQAERVQWEELRGFQVSILHARESQAQHALLDGALEEHSGWAQARCAYAASIYEGGSLARLVGANCMRDAIAEHALELIGRYDEL